MNRDGTPDEPAGEPSEEPNDDSDDEGREESVGQGPGRITDEQWASVIDAWNAPAGTNSELSADEIRERLGEDEGYTPPDPGPIGFHTGSPFLILCWVLAVGGPVTLLLGVLFVRPVPGLLVGAGVLAGLAGIAGLFWQLPKERQDRDDDGSAV